MQRLLQEVRHAIRKLSKSPGFSLVSILTLALGIGAATAVFSVVEAVLLRPLPFVEPDRLVVIRERVPVVTNLDSVTITAPDVLAYSQRTQSFEHSGGYRQFTLEISGVGQPSRVTAARMNADVFPALGVSPLLGRTFTREEDEQAHPVVVLSYSLWMRYFNGDRNVIGKTLDIERKPYSIIGVMPPGFEFPLVPGQLNQSQFWIPVSFTPEQRSNHSGSWDYDFVARLKPGISIEQAQADASRAAAQIVASYPAYMSRIKMTAVVLPLAQQVVAEARPLVRVLFLAVLVVLLIACANLAGLLLVRAIRRRHEIAVQLALGAPGRVLVRESMLESLLISLTGGVLGVVFASVVLKSWVRFLPETLPRTSEISLNWTVVGFAVFVSVVTGLLCGLAPAFAATRTTVHDTLKEVGRSGGASAGHARLRSFLVVGEIATALVLLTTAGLLLRSFEKMRQVDPGFRPEQLVIANYSLPEAQYQTQSRINAFHQELLLRLQQLPGTKSVALGSALPMADPADNSVFAAEGYTPAPNEPLNLGSFTLVLGDYFQTTGIPLLRGRFLKDSDDENAPLVAVVNRKLSEHYWPGQDPVGKRIKFGTADMNLPWITVVGEVADTKQGALDSSNREQIYQPMRQQVKSSGSLAAATDVAGRDMRIALRTSLPPEQIVDTVRRTVWSIDPRLAVDNIQTMEQAISQTEAPRLFQTSVLTAFALVAVLLAVIGIYGVIAFSVLQRIHEMAIRFAMGARPRDVIWLVVQTGLKLGGVGCLLGVAGSVASTHLLRSFLFGVSPLDPLAFAAAAVTILALALLASFMPARRAGRIDPMQLLRSE